MLPNVRILIQNGALGGAIRFAEGVAGFIGTGVAVNDKIQIGDPRVFFNLDEAVTAGITLADNPRMYRTVKEFYDVAGNGAECYVMLVADTMNQTSMVDNTNANGARKLLDFANGRIRLLGTTFLPPGGYSLVTTNGLDADVFTAITNAQVLANAYAAAQMPLRVLLEGRALVANPATPTDISALTNNRVGVVLGSTVSGETASVGLAVGRAAAIPVQRKISRVKDGGLPINEAYVGTTKVDQYAGVETLHDKGYICIRKFPTLGGYFFTGDPMAAGATDDFNTLNRGRTIDKAAVLAYAAYVQEVDDEVLVNEDGTLDAGFVAYLEAIIENKINQLMTANREISSVTAYVDPAQNIISLAKTKVVLKIVPVGHNSFIEVELGFDNPALAA